MIRVKKLSLTACFMLAIILTFSCSSDDSGDSGNSEGIIQTNLLPFECDEAFVIDNVTGDTLSTTPLSENGQIPSDDGINYVYFIINNDTIKTSNFNYEEWDLFNWGSISGGQGKIDEIKDYKIGFDCKKNSRPVIIPPPETPQPENLQPMDCNSNGVLQRGSLEHVPTSPALTENGAWPEDFVYFIKDNNDTLYFDVSGVTEELKTQDVAVPSQDYIAYFNCFAPKEPDAPSIED